MLDRLIHRWLRVPYTLHVHSLQQPDYPRATVVLLHGIGSSSKMWHIFERSALIDKDVQVFAVDLLGFGSSPRPHWETYDATAQVRSLRVTLAGQHMTGPLIIVGHSLGALVATHFAHHTPQAVQALILCSPPLYNPEDESHLTERQLRSIYRKFIAAPQLNRVITSDLARHYRLLNPGFQVDESNLQMFLDTLDAAIINQTSLSELAELAQPIDIFYGQFDPVIVSKNLRRLARRQHITLHRLLSSHEIDTRYAKLIAHTINHRVQEQLRDQTR